MTLIRRYPIIPVSESRRPESLVLATTVGVAVLHLAEAIVDHSLVILKSRAIRGGHHATIIGTWKTIDCETYTIFESVDP